MNELIVQATGIKIEERPRATMIALLLGILAVSALAACGGSGNAPSSISMPSAQMPLPSGDERQGRYVGTVTHGMTRHCRR
jgi:hypothetical protein